MLKEIKEELGLEKDVKKEAVERLGDLVKSMPEGETRKRGEEELAKLEGLQEGTQDWSVSKTYLEVRMCTRAEALHSPNSLVELKIQRWYSSMGWKSVGNLIGLFADLVSTSLDVVLPPLPNSEMPPRF